jgi:hypothetical protein
MVTLTVEDAVKEALAHHPARSIQTEALMRLRIGDEGDKWAFLGDVKRATLNVPKGGNSIRLIDALRKDKVAAISQKVADGAVMPAVIVTRKGRVLIEGFHRYHGYEDAGKPEIPCYEIDLPALEQEQFLIEITQMAGDRLLPDEVKKLALKYLQLGFSESRISSMLATPLSTLRQWAAISKLQARLQPTGNRYDLRGWSNHLCGMVLQIRNLPTLVAAVDLINDAKLKSGEAQDIIKSVRACQSQAEELQILTDQRAALKDRIAEAKLRINCPAYIRPIWMQSLPALSLLVKYDAAQYADTAPDDQIARLMTLWSQVASTAEDVLAKLGERGVRK